MAFMQRNTIQINLVRVLPQLKELAIRVPNDSPFTKKYGLLINLVTTNFEEDMVHVLFQFFDPKHHCFTFPNYQLVPTMEEFSQLLGECLFLIDYPSPVLRETQDLRRLLELYICNGPTLWQIGK